MISIIAAIALAAVVITVISVKNHTANGRTRSYSTMQEAEKAAPFNMEYSDRLCGYTVSEFVSNSSTIEVRYGGAGVIRKTLGVADNSGKSLKYPESQEQSVDGRTVTLKGDGGLVYIAVWNDNNFAYTISVNEGIPAAEMADYIEATR